MTLSLDSPPALRAAVEACTLPKECWTHEAHLAVGLAVLDERRDVHAALDHLRVVISRYNVSTGGENTDTGGYHETITAFYVWAIDRFLHEQRELPGPLEPRDPRGMTELVTSLWASSWGQRDAVTRYFSRASLATVAARRTVLRPDLVDVVDWPFSVGYPND